MKLVDARFAITSALGRMNALYQQTVFDEWILFKLSSEQSVILGYEGPRADSYQKTFREDIIPLSMELNQRQMSVGDFAFAQDAKGTGFDACIRLGPASYLFCNNSIKSMEDIRKSPLWLSAQKPFADLSGKFQADPLV
jgi:hypothetical protein